MNTGDIITFGTYTQQEDLTIVEPIEWIVLDAQADRALVLSKKAIDYHKYHDKTENTAWRNCELRRWLNDGFMDKAFTPDEKARIIMTGTENGCTDQVFCLSRDEVEKYLPDVLCEPTEYCNVHGTYIRTPHARWWLRTQGATPLLALIVGHDGIIFGLGVNIPSAAVRPAMWIRL